MKTNSNKITKRILVTGYPHCGTTMLRAKIGDCKNTYEQVREFGSSTEYSPNMPFDFYVWKHPDVYQNFRQHTFGIKSKTPLADTAIIPIIRNPWHLFTSMHKRSLQEKTFTIYDGSGHGLKHYLATATTILDAMKNNYDDIYPIRYEDMFENDYQKLKEIFDKIGLEYDDDIFYTQKKVYQHNGSEYIEDYNKNGKQDGNLRMWQINQPFQNMNKEVDLPEDFCKMLSESEIIKELGYSDPRK